MPADNITTAPPVPFSEPQALSLLRCAVSSLLFALCLFSVLWLDLIRLLGTQWEAREQYAYGWFVPIFALGLLWRRWLDRPVGDQGTQGLRDQGTQSPRVPESLGPPQSS
jgi:Transmembrane exosortase (Exosortase_EpsH)